VVDIEEVHAEQRPVLLDIASVASREGRGLFMRTDSERRVG